MLATASASSADVEIFEREIRPVLVGTCFRCHGGERTSGGLRVDSRESLLRGGESGPALIPSDATGSLLVRAIEHAKDVSAMPPGNHLKEGQIAAFKAWINAGAEWPESAPAFVSRKHWSLEPIEDHAAPEVRDASWCRTSVDAFVLVKLEDAGLSPKPEADRRTLIRRITYDLTGLPPAPGDVDAFVNDPRGNDEAFKDVVDRLLASPSYGEHWGRHWLDLVRYADTAGENSDHPLPHAWKYRNWVIEAFNSDKPYDAFVREQLAGDLLPAANNAEYAANHIATSYLAIARRFGHDIDKDIHLTREDQIDNFGKTFLGLSLGCCRCHDHKYDPLPAEDYYGLYGVFDSTKLSFPGCEPKQQPADLVALIPPADAEIVRAEWSAKAAEFDQQIAKINVERTHFLAAIKDGFATSTEPVGDGTIPDGGSIDLWADGRRIDVHRGEIIGLTISPDGNYGADTTLLDFRVSELDGARRTWTLADTISEFSKGNPVRDAASGQSVWCFLDPTNTPRLLSSFVEGIGGRKELKGWRNEENPSVFVNTSSQAIGVWTTLPAKAFCVHPGPESSVAVAWISPLDGVVSISGRVTDGHPGGPNGVGWRVDHVRSSETARALDQLAALDAGKRDLNRLKSEELGAEPKIPVAYAAIEGTPHNSRLQQRGNPEEPGDEVARHFPQLLGGASLGDAMHSGRLELARQLMQVDNPLAARVMANRIWQWHFGRGIVATPNDFGSRGAAPTHAELLDHLAVRFRDGWSVKNLTREIVMSATYRQASDDGVTSPLYTGFARRRLSAEELRDTLLAVSGQLDTVPGEAHPFPPESSWGFTQHGPFAAEYPTQKRSVYMLQKRNRRARFFALFDGADPNVSTPVRDVTTVPSQALYFMNDPFVHESAVALVERVSQTGSSRRERLDSMCRLMFGRTATNEEEADFAIFERDYLASTQDVEPSEREKEAWRAYARGLLASNELLYVD